MGFKEVERLYQVNSEGVTLFCICRFYLLNSLQFFFERIFISKSSDILTSTTFAFKKQHKRERLNKK